LQLSNSIFSRLRRLHAAAGFPAEDYLTEMIASFVELNPVAFINWLRQVGVTQLPTSTALHVRTQFHCAANLEDETRDKYPDLFIRLTSGKIEEWIFIEAKVGSELSGDDQLQQYARILGRSESHRKTLLFITRDYYPQDPREVLQDIEQARRPHFIQKRWFDVATAIRSHVNSHPEDSLSRNILAYMEEQQLTRATQFSPADLAAISAFPHALGIMRSVFDGEIRDRFEAVCGTVMDDWDTCIRVARNNALDLRTNSKQPISFGLSFWLPGDDLGYPGVLGHVHCEFRKKGNEKLVAALHDYASRKPDDWVIENVSMSSDWGRIMKYRSIASFLGEEDHVAALKKFFEEVLSAFDELKRLHPDIAWFVSSEKA
jgi:hypothetical protein